MWACAAFPAYCLQILCCYSNAELFVFFMFPPFSLKWVWASARFKAFGREPVRRRLAKCDAGSSRTGGFFPAAGASLRWAGVLTYIFLRCPHVGATLGFFPCAAHTLAVGAKAAHSGDTRLTARCRRSAHPQGR